jgi:hypothetical protein
VFPVKYELDVYMLIGRNSVCKGLRKERQPDDENRAQSGLPSRPDLHLGSVH